MNFMDVGPPPSLVGSASFDMDVVIESVSVAAEYAQIQIASCYCSQTGINSEAMNIERLKRITVEEGKCGGRPCIRGLRIRVSDILDLLAGGASFEEILADYPFLEREDIPAAIEYAARQADHVVLQA